MLCIDEASLVAIKEYGQRAYPEECCGILFGMVSPDGIRSLNELHPLQNRHQDSRRNRFLIEAEDMRRAEQYARQKGMDILGFFHSHPDHEPRPSQFDQEQAWPWYYYIIVSINQGIPGSLTCWELDEDRRRFHPVEVSLNTSKACENSEERSHA